MHRKMLYGLLLAAAGASQAAPVTVLKTEVAYELAVDGTWTVEQLITTRINEQAAVRGAGQMPVQFSESLQEMEILEAYTTTRDGERIDVPVDRIITQQQPVSTGAPSFSDYKVKNVVFPRVEIGSTVTLRSRMKQRRPFLPGVFTLGISYSRFVEFESASLTLRAPEGRALQVHARDVAGGPVASSRRGMREWRWTHGPTVADTPEPGSLAPEGISPGVMVSSLDGYPALAEAYMAGAAPTAKVTPAVQKLADEITGGIADKRAQAEAIYRWVSSEIRYVAIAMGAGGYVPHAADEVIAARYGDCKDKTTLLVALLAARGIRAAPVLINTGSYFKLPELPILSAFNHVIAYLPEFDLYLDPTVSLGPFDALPAPLRSKPALVAGDSRTGASIAQTPKMDAQRDRTVTRTTATVAPDGSVSGTNLLEVHGAADVALRTRLSILPAQALPQLGKSMLASGGQTGDAKVTLGNLRDFSQSSLLTIEFTTPARVNLPGPGALTGGFGLYGSSGARSFATSILRLDRKLDFPCPSGGTEETLELALPKAMKITRLPDAADLASPFGRFTNRYEFKDGKLLAAQKLYLDQPRAICTAADHAELRKFATSIDRELRKQILYE